MAKVNEQSSFRCSQYSRWQLQTCFRFRLDSSLAPPGGWIRPSPPSTKLDQRITQHIYLKHSQTEQGWPMAAACLVICTNIWRRANLQSDCCQVFVVVLPPSPPWGVITSLVNSWFKQYKQRSQLLFFYYY